MAFVPLRRRGRSCIVRLFVGNNVLSGRHVRSDDLVTFGAEKGESLVSAILSVKYSRSTWYAVHGSVLPRPGRCGLLDGG
jgi:hypothetical protein